MIKLGIAKVHPGSYVVQKTKTTYNWGFLPLKIRYCCGFILFKVLISLTENAKIRYGWSLILLKMLK